MTRPRASAAAVSLLLATLVVAGCGGDGAPLVVAVPGTDAANQVVPTTAGIVVKPYVPTVPTSDVAATTTLPAPLAKLLPLGEGGIGPARFGDSPDDAVAAVSRWLKDPDEDTGWLGAETPYGTCPQATLVRMVRWGWLLLIMADTSPYGAGREHFAGWVYDYGLDEFAIYPDGLVFSTGVGLGVPVEVLRLAHPGGVEVNGPRFEVGRSFSGRFGDDRLVSRLEAGLRCPKP